MIELFLDKEMHNRFEGTVLDENKLYFVKLKEHNPEVIKKEITRGQCSDFISWHPSNTVGQIQFRDVAGYANLFGNRYEVKSTKLLTDLSGHNQIEYLLKDISRYSSMLVFSPAAPAGLGYHIDPKKLTNNTYYIYKYLSTHLFQDGNDSLQELLDLILGNPHFTQSTSPAYVPTVSTKKFNHSTFQRVAGSVKDSELIPAGHELCQKPFVSKLMSTSAGDKIFPKNLYSVTNTICYDTPENRFLKHFLLWCQEIFMNVSNLYPQYQIRDDCAKSLRIIRKYLFHPFFETIGAFSFLPTSSSVLTNRVGYRELFLHYLKCRSQPKVFSDYLADIVEFMEIKNISTLYEYWVFFMIAKELFGSNATLQVIEHQNVGNILKYGLRISEGSSNLYYNKTYGHSPEGSYNFSLRPDISLEINGDGKFRRFFFDAKYSNTSIPSSQDDPVAVYKNANVVKMLSYLEAINNSDLAVIVYPGTKFSFYCRHFKEGANYISRPELMNDFEGVGALPLSPGHAESEAKFSTFMARLKNHFLNN